MFLLFEKDYVLVLGFVLSCIYVDDSPDRKVTQHVWAVAPTANSLQAMSPEVLKYYPTMSTECRLKANECFLQEAVNGGLNLLFFLEIDIISKRRAALPGVWDKM